MQDDIYTRERVVGGVLADAFNGRSCHLRTHPVRQLTPPLVSHFIDVAIGARQVAAAMYL
jgi:hypothetical protein